MEKLMGSLDLGFLIRTAFAGAFFFISYHVTRQGWATTAAQEPKLETALVVSLLAGFACYAFFRAAIYPVIEQRLLPDMKKPGADYWLISDNTIEWKVSAWEIGEKSQERDSGFAKHVRIWGDYTHFLYVSGLCVILGMVASRVVAQPSSECPDWCVLIVIAVLFWIAALVSDLRLIRVHEYCKGRNTKPEAKPGPSPVSASSD